MCAKASVVVIEAAGGYGKSVFGTELVTSWLAIGIEVQVDHEEVPAEVLAARLRGATLEAGFSEAVTASGSGDATSSLDALLSALGDERCAFVIDDAHNAGRDAAGLLEHLATHLRDEQRLVVLARRLPRGAERLRRAEYVHLDSRDLAMTPDEVLDLSRLGFGLKIGRSEASRLDRTTGGWTAATVLALARASRTGETADAVAGAMSGRTQGEAVATILEEAMGAMSEADRPVLAQLARLPLLDAAVAERVGNERGLFDRLLAAGLPLAPSRGGWWDVPGPVRDYLSTLAPLDPAAVREAANAYRQRGELGAALQLLLASGDPAAAAVVLAESTYEEAEAMDALELQAIIDQLPDEVVEAHPQVLTTVGRAYGVAFRYPERVTLNERAGEIARRRGDAVLSRVVAAEHANDLCRQFSYDEAIRLARRVLDEAANDELYTRARALYALGRSLYLRQTPGLPRDEEAGAEAERCFERCGQLYRTLGSRSPLATLTTEMAEYFDFANGRGEAALARFDDALELSADRPRRWAWTHLQRAKVALELGLDDSCRSSIEAARRIAEMYDDELYRAYVHYRLALLSAQQGDSHATLEHVRKTELHRNDNWWNQVSAHFLADAANMLDQVGHTALAREYLERAMAEPKNAGAVISFTRAAIEARHGDPTLAEQLISDGAGEPLQKRLEWRLTLLRAYAAFRRGDADTAGALAARSFEEAARLGQPRLPMIVERPITEELIGLAIATGQPAALALEATTLPIAVAVLGQFAVTEAGVPVPVPPGQEARLLKYVAVKGGRALAEQAIDAFWPDASPETGRNRLRTVLSRLRSAIGDVVVREGDLLMLDSRVRVDLDLFLEEARKAQALAADNPALATSVAQGAMARYRGELLGEDLYEEWTEAPRERARRAMLELLDLCATEAARRGDLDALRRVVERTIELDPYDDERYLRAAFALLEQGRRGEALTIVRRARNALADIGIEPPHPLLELERSIVA